MASNDQSFKAGEAKGQAQEKAGQMADAVKDKAQAAKDQTFEAAQAAKDKTGQAAQAAKDKAGEMKESAPTGQDNSGGGIVQKAGQQIKDTAQGAVDAVKNTFGMADDATKK